MYLSTLTKVRLGNNGAVLRDHRNKIIACMDGGRPSFEDVLASHEFVNVQSKHSKVNMFVTQLVNNANAKFWINDLDVISKIFFILTFLCFIKN